MLVSCIKGNSIKEKVKTFKLKQVKREKTKPFKEETIYIGKNLLCNTYVASAFSYSPP
jgi:hypothetical protein